MKHLLFFLCLLALLSSVQGTEIEVPSSNFKYKGVYPLTHSHTTNTGICVYEEIGRSLKEREAVFKVFNSDLKSETKVTLTLSPTAHVNDFIFDGETFYVSVTHQSFHPDEVMYSFNEAGVKIEERKIEKIPMTVSGNKDYTSKWYSCPDGGVLYLRYIKEKKLGFQIEKLDSQLNVIWVQKIIPNKGSFTAPRLAVGDQSITVLKSQYSWGNNISNTLLFLNPKDGSILAENSLNEEHRSYYPTILKQVGNELFTAGMYYENQKISWNDPDGMFVSKYSAQGKYLGDVFSSWRDLKPVFKTATPGYWFKVNPDVMFHDLLVDGDRMYFLGELYKTGKNIVDPMDDEEEESFARIRLMDFVAFELNTDLEILGIDRISREHMLLDIAGGNEENDRILESGNTLEFVERILDQKVFSYQFGVLTETKGIAVEYSNYQDYENYLILKNETGSILSSKKLTKFKPEPIAVFEKVRDMWNSEMPLYVELEKTGLMEYDASIVKNRGAIKINDHHFIEYEYSVFDGSVFLDSKVLPESD